MGPREMDRGEMGPLTWSGVDPQKAESKEVVAMAASTSSEERARLRQRRTMTYFIEAAEKIIREQGLGAVTIRSVSDAAGYTSATLYNYFDNLNHLIFFATMGYLDDYAKDLLKEVEGVTDPLETYLIVAHTFSKHAYQHPEVFAIRFAINRSEKFDEYAQQYYELFPDKGYPGFDLLSRASVINTLSRRNAIYLQPLVEMDLLSEADAEQVNELTTILFRHYLQEVRLGYIDAQSALDKRKLYFHHVIDFYLKRHREVSAGEKEGVSAVGRGEKEGVSAVGRGEKEG
ncbi:MAG: TetR/AcrR family transcriptional regulator, partial [Coriobacteriales bacterium]|nr:TetR/AcrR family transcriptional regulator [Coriobacteriales bacterium]